MFTEKLQELKINTWSLDDLCLGRFLDGKGGDIESDMFEEYTYSI